MGKAANRKKVKRGSVTTGFMSPSYFLSLTSADFLEIVTKAKEQGCKHYYCLFSQPDVFTHMRNIAEGILFPIPVTIGKSQSYPEG